MGPVHRAARRARHGAEIHQAQIAATLAAFLGKDYRAAMPNAAPPIADVLGRQPEPR